MSADPTRPGELATLDKPVQAFIGGSTRAKAFGEKLGIHTVGDLLWHFPRRYDHFGDTMPIREMELGVEASVYATVVSVSVRPMRQKRGALLEAVISDGSDTIGITLFGRSEGQLRASNKGLVPGARGYFSGALGEYRGRLQLQGADYHLHDPDVLTVAELEALTRMPTPVYAGAQGLPTWLIGQVIRSVLKMIGPGDVPEFLPDDVLQRHDWGPRLAAFIAVHEPIDDDQWRAARERFRFEEAFLLQAALAQRRAAFHGQRATARPRRPGGILDAFDDGLPFRLTAGQREIAAQLEADLAAPAPMHRLLQGEVGSGKTVLALRAMLQVVDAGGQAALLAPTEVLATQHLHTMRALLGPLAEEGLLATGPHVGVRLLTGALGAAARKRALLDAASGEAGITVGTHALLSEPVQFADLGLVVVDEQHRFGVEQRDALRSKAVHPPHTLVMTATPIPRTVAMTVFGDMEVSSLAEIPAGRPGVSTHVVPRSKPAWMDRMWQRAAEQIAQGRRVYVVCPRISESAEEPGATGPSWGSDAASASGASGGASPGVSVADTLVELRSEPHLAGVRIGELHGRMSSDEKERAMTDFASGTTPLLVATTVIEVGVDVPEATVMIVLDADRFGLSQLHQLRGRIGRGAHAGLCFLVSDVEEGSDAARRLSLMESCSDGFLLAEQDLDIRSEGDVLGAEQSGKSSLRLLRVTRDRDVVADAREAASALIEKDPKLLRAPELAAALRRRVGDREEFLDRS